MHYSCYVTFLIFVFLLLLLLAAAVFRLGVSKTLSECSSDVAQGQDLTQVVDPGRRLGNQLASSGPVFVDAPVQLLNSFWDMVYTIHVVL